MIYRGKNEKGNFLAHDQSKVFKLVKSTCVFATGLHAGEEFESVSEFLVGNRLRMVSLQPYSICTFAKRFTLISLSST